MRSDDRLAALRAKLAARKGKYGFEANARAIEEEITRLETDLSSDNPPSR